ncbi:hypothetical protein [Archangium primigenium]|uniref:hypothetical protein n=1 Tax=[Archangium] primigenium TaxID=2792470 RepID=UPI00195D16EF|nr:hypothetical protein [Archangium primigenium]MBM7117608.1 hypothetical protein [Archangium primigenium]
MAEVVAALHPDKGCVYRVLPEAPLEDADNPGVFWLCTRARVVSVHPLDDATELRILKGLAGEAS